MDIIGLQSSDRTQKVFTTTHSDVKEIDALMVQEGEVVD